MFSKRTIGLKSPCKCFCQIATFEAETTIHSLHIPKLSSCSFMPNTWTTGRAIVHGGLPLSWFTSGDEDIARQQQGVSTRAGAPCPLICNPMLKSMRLQSFALQYHIHCPWVGPGLMKAQILFVNHFANREPSLNLLYACNSLDVSCSSKLHTASHVLETLQQCGGWRRHKLSSLLGLSAEPRAAGMRCRLAQRARAAGFAAPALPRHLRRLDGAATSPGATHRAS